MRVALRFSQRSHGLWYVMIAVFVLCLGLVPAAPTGSGRLDPFLRQLAATDPQRVVQVIVQKVPGGRTETALPALGGTQVADLHIINAFTARMTAGSLLRLAQRADVRFISYDGPVTPAGKTSTTTSTTNVNTSGLLTSYPYSANVVQTWNQASGKYIGTGITVAVLDTGVAGAVDFGGRVIQKVAVNTYGTYNADKYGHGTHVAGIVAGKDKDGRYIGIAPGANLVSVKVSDDNGGASTSDFINGIQWVIDNKATYNIRVINISATAANQLGYNQDPLDAAVEKAWFAGIVVVVAAGNHGGESCSTCYAPANDPYVITVGAVDDHGTKDLNDDTLPSWTSSGKTQDGFVKPDILAPGSKIVSVLAAQSDVLATNWPQNIVNGSWFVMGGTSMAAPVVSGVVALMLQANPNLTPNQVKWLIQNTARTYKGQLSGTPGIVNGNAAVNYTVGPGAKKPGTANTGLTPSASLDTSTGQVLNSNSYWSNSYWSNSCCL